MQMTHHGEGACIQIADHIAAISTLTAERDSAKRELAEIQADAKAERKKYEALREERDALKATVARLCPMIYATRGEQSRLDFITNKEYLDMVHYRHSGRSAVEAVTEALASRTTPPAKEPK